MHSFVRHIKRLLEKEHAEVYLLMLATLAALIWANTHWHETYDAFWTTHFLSFGDVSTGMSFRHVVNDVFMSLFFLIVGCELKRERFEGELASLRQVRLTFLAALGGMVVPALTYVVVGEFFAFTMGDAPFFLRGWAIPAATDIAFALGVFGFLSARLPSSLRTFLLALAIIDDLGSIFIIGVFYSSNLNYEALAAGGVLLLLLYNLNRRDVESFWPYALLGVALWFCVYFSGVHPTLSGLFLAAFLPLDETKGTPLLKKVEGKAHSWVAFLILPVFALANAGVSLEGITQEMLLSPLFLGIVLGLFLGKQVGVFGTTWLCVHLGWGQKPKGASWGQLYGTAVLCGVGFTMSLFIGLLAFQDTTAMIETRLGVLVGSFLSALVGYGLLVFFSRPKKEGALNGPLS